MTTHAEPAKDAEVRSPEQTGDGAAVDGLAGRSAYGPPLLPPEERVLSTLNRDGSRRWLLPRVSPGRFLSWRRWSGYFLIALFALLPFVQINGKPFILLNLAQREFTILGFTFLPTDTILLALFLLGLIVGVFLLTALLGRVWCGWACPQTVYLEFVYRPIERLFDGTRGRGGRPSERIATWRRIAKRAVFFGVSFYLANVFLAYFVGVEALSRWVTQSPLEHPLPFLVMAVTTLLMLFDFGYFREQTCIVACPYGRLQSVLLDRQSLIVSYDVKRGEPRGKLRTTNNELRVLQPNEPNAIMRVQQTELKRSTRGDCIDCNLCVTTCPTGIDIRGGLQMECVGCAQCIDACDAVMEKIGRPRGLIRYSSQGAIEGERRKLVRPRVLLYPAVLLIVVTVFAVLFLGKQNADVTLLRGFGRPFAELPDGTISNSLRVKITNRSGQSAAYVLSIVNDPEIHLLGGTRHETVAAGATREVEWIISAPLSAFTDGIRDVRLLVTDGHDFSREFSYRLLGPQSRPAVVERGGPP